MAKGDHISVSHPGYTHHGIDAGDGTVIHFGRGIHQKREAQVEQIELEQFSGGLPVATVSSEARFSADEIVERAVGRLGQDDYDLFENNCEHFANWCRTGIAHSRQIDVADSVCRRGIAATSRLVARRIVKRATLRPGNPASWAGDVAQLSVEFASIRSGKSAQQTLQSGRRTGALASSGVGYMLGGPAGAAIGLGHWMFGEWVGQAATSATRETARRLFSRPDIRETPPAE